MLQLQSRLFGEMNNLFSYGAATQSLLLLWKFHLLDAIMPLYASHLTLHRFSRFVAKHKIMQLQAVVC